jgi:pimeloyl-ACP methyl ester carboxylesterase
VARARVNGLDIAYEVLGEGDPVALTPGGRLSKDAFGIRELARALAEGGKQVLIWDRPNTGASDMCFEGEFESEMHADVLAGLIRELGLGPTTLGGGSAGARTSLLAAARHPEVVGRLALWWISGGFFSLASLAQRYCGEPWTAAKRGGMKAVAELAAFQDTLAKNPANRERLLATDPEEFAAAMERWGPRFLYEPDWAGIQVPTLIFRSSPTDLAHPRRTGERVHDLIPRSQVVDPPVADDEWDVQSEAYSSSMGNDLFRSWPALAPPILHFLAESGP